MISIVISTKKKDEVVDITDLINIELGKLKIKEGLCHIFLKHTTAAITTADLDPGTDLDMLDAFRGMIPQLNYRHPHDPSHVSDHILSALIGTSLALLIKSGELILGTWQRVVLIEFNGPREREILIGIK